MRSSQLKEFIFKTAVIGFMGMIFMGTPAFSEPRYIRFQDTRLFCLVEPKGHELATIRTNGKIKKRSFSEVTQAARAYVFWAKTRISVLETEKRRAVVVGRKKKVDATVARIKTGIDSVNATRRFAVQCRSGRLDAQALETAS